MSRTEEVELTNMCMICDGRGNVLVQNKTNHPAWHGWNFPGGHVEKGEFVTPSVIREMREETGLTIENPKLCGIKEFHKAADGKRYIVFLYTASRFSGELKSSDEGEVFWYPLADLLLVEIALRRIDGAIAHLERIGNAAFAFILRHLIYAIAQLRHLNAV